MTNELIYDRMNTLHNICHGVPSAMHFKIVEKLKIKLPDIILCMCDISKAESFGLADWFWYSAFFLAVHTKWAEWLIKIEAAGKQETAARFGVEREPGAVSIELADV